MISKSGLATCTIAILVMAGKLTAQDPVFTCTLRASALVNVPVNNIGVNRRGGLENGNDILVWNAKLPNGQLITGFCEASPRTGRVVRLGTDREDIKRVYRMTPVDAERVCRQEARARFSPGNGLLFAKFLPNTSTKSTYRVGWRYGSMAGTIRKGRCEIDSLTGHIRKFDANYGW